jgi:Family of unknown function (DUF5681)
MSAANAAEKQRQRGRPFRKGMSGNPRGKAPGTRNRATLAAEALLDGEAEALTRKAIEMAKQGDITALRLCLDRVVAPRRERRVQFRLPELRSAGDAAGAMGAIVQAVANGDLTPSEAAELSKLVEAYVRSHEATEFDRRIRALEERDANARKA